MFLKGSVASVHCSESKMVEVIMKIKRQNENGQSSLVLMVFPDRCFILLSSLNTWVSTASL